MFHYLPQPQPFAIWDPTFLQVLAETQKKYEVLTDQYSKLHEQTTKLRQKKRKLEMELEGIADANRANRRRGPRRLKICDFRGRYMCRFPQCCHEYGSELALNHHMRCKHGAGTKTQREMLARLIVMAQRRGESPPEMTVKFPPGYLENFRKDLQAQQAFEKK